MDDKMKGMIREILFYVVLLFFLLVVINGQQDTNSYRQNSHLIALFTNVNVVQLYRYAGSAGVVALLSEILCAVFVLVITVVEVVKICRMRLSYFKQVWNVLQWSAMILFYSSSSSSSSSGKVWSVLQWSAIMLFYIAVALYTARSVCED